MSLLQCVSSQHGQTTPEKTLSNPWYGKGFCEPDQYNSALNRCKGGYKSLELGIEMFKDLAKIFENHADAIKSWSETNQKHLGQSKEFGTAKLSWLNSIRAVEHVSENSREISKNIQESVVKPMTDYKNHQYGKSFLKIKKVHDFEKEFKEVQKSWTHLLSKMNEAKKCYQEAKEKLKNAESNEKTRNSDVGSDPEDQRRAKAYTEKCRSDRDSCRKQYKNLFEEMEKKKPIYESDMFKILARMDTFEKERLDYFHKTFIELQRSTSLKNDERHTKMSDAFQSAIKQLNIDDDIKYFNTNYGRDTKTSWPVFED